MKHIRRYQPPQIRFHVGDKCCSLIGTSATFMEARAIAQQHFKEHLKTKDPIPSVSIFDSMAEIVEPQIWSVTDTAVEVSGRKD